MKTITETELRDIVGPVAFGEYEGASDYYKPNLMAWASELRTLSDDEFMHETVSAIYGSALVNSWRGNWEHEHFKASACHTEAKRRHVAAGHSEDCRGETAYGRAHTQLMRDHGYTPQPHVDCTCGSVPGEQSEGGSQ